MFCHPRLTVTKVVFEYITASLDTFCKSRLTVTKVVFEFMSQMLKTRLMN